MASEILGLFTTPEQYQQNQLAQARSRAFQEVQLDPFQQAALGARTAGYQFGQAVGGALGGQDPQLQLIARRQQLLGQLDRSDPMSYRRVAKMASDAGDQQLAQGIAEAGMEAESKLSLIQQRSKEKQAADPFQQVIRSGKYTPESMATYQQSGNVGDLVLLEKTKDDVVVVGNALVSKTTGKPIYQGDKPQKYSDFATKLIEAGLSPDTEPFQRRMLDYINQETKGAAQGKGNVYLGGISVDTGVAAKAAGKVIGENVANVESQFSLQTAIGDSLKLIDNGIYAGAYGPEKGFVAKYSLGTVGDAKKLENTEVFIANIGEIVIPRLVQFGGNDSNEELKYLQKVVAGDQRLEPESMKRILISAEKKIANNIRRLQKQAESGKTGENLPLQPMESLPSQPKATKRYNPQTKKLEVITGE